MNDNPFEIKEEACASSPDHRRYLLIQAVDTETGEIVWAVGDDQICAVTRADFIRTPEIRYDEPLHAMKFRTYEEAQAYIDTSSRSGQETAIVRRSLPPRILPGLAVELRLCSAAASRSRTACWRRRPAGFVSGDAKGGKTNESNTEKQDDHPDGGSPGTGGRA